MRRWSRIATTCSRGGSHDVAGDKKGTGAFAAVPCSNPGKVRSERLCLPKSVGYERGRPLPPHVFVDKKAPGRMVYRSPHALKPAVGRSKRQRRPSLGGLRGKRADARQLGSNLRCWPLHRVKRRRPFLWRHTTGAGHLEWPQAKATNGLAHGLGMANLDVLVCFQLFADPLAPFTVREVVPPSFTLDQWSTGPTEHLCNERRARQPVTALRRLICTVSTE